MRTFGLISDQHFHNWSAFSVTNASGINSRLQTQIDELYRCADEVRKAGGDTIFNAGDTFHVRGNLAPSVLNPVMDAHRELINQGFKIVILAGNHDLESKSAERVSSAVTALEGVGCRVVNAPSYDVASEVVMIPWIPNFGDLKSAIEVVTPADRPRCDLILHAPIDGVIPGLPDCGLTGEWLGELGFRRVFSGHYHFHKEVVPGKVWSVGASTPQTWSDVNAKSGFLICTEDEVQWFSSHAPKFIEIDASTNPDEVPLIADGNYVRCRINSSKSADVEAMRAYLNDCGAKGVVILQDVKPAAAARSGGPSVKAGATLEASINDFISSAKFERTADLSRLCQDVLTSVRSVAS